MNKGYAQCLICELFFNCEKDGVLLIPGLDVIATRGKEQDSGRILRCEIDLDEDETCNAVDEFGDLYEALFEIADWYSNSEEQYGVKPDEEFMANPESMRVWEKYINGYKEFDVSSEGIAEYCGLKNITGPVKELLVLVINHFCGLLVSYDDENILDVALRRLAEIFFLNRFAKRIERIDMLMDERMEKSIFPEYIDLTIDDFRRIASYLSDEFNIMTRKARIFYDHSRTDEDVCRLYSDVLNMD